MPNPRVAIVDPWSGTSNCPDRTSSTASPLLYQRALPSTVDVPTSPHSCWTSLAKNVYPSGCVNSAFTKYAVGPPKKIDPVFVERVVPLSNSALALRTTNSYGGIGYDAVIGSAWLCSGNWPFHEKSPASQVVAISKYREFKRTGPPTQYSGLSSNPRVKSVGNIAALAGSAAKAATIVMMRSFFIVLPVCRQFLLAGEFGSPRMCTISE